MGSTVINESEYSLIFVVSKLANGFENGMGNDFSGLILIASGLAFFTIDNLFFFKKLSRSTPRTRIVSRSVSTATFNDQASATAVLCQTKRVSATFSRYTSTSATS